MITTGHDTTTHRDPARAEAPARIDCRTAGRRTGDAAEAAAERFLAARGLVPLMRQYVRRIGEIDLVMVEPATGTIVFVEVRCRSAGARLAPALTVGAAKRRRLRRTAAAWLQRHADPRRPARIDVVGMTPGAPGTDEPASAARVGGDASVDVGGAVRWEGYRLSWLPDAVGG